MRRYELIVCVWGLAGLNVGPALEARNWLTFWKSEKPALLPGAPAQPTPEEQPDKAPLPSAPQPSAAPPSQASLPSFMAPLPDDPWADYTDHSSAFAPSLTLQGFLYVDEENWNVWLNDCLLTPELRSLKVGPFLAEVASMTSRTVTFHCTGPEEITITLSAGQIFNLQTHTLRQQ